MTGASGNQIRLPWLEELLVQHQPGELGVLSGGPARLLIGCSGQMLLFSFRLNLLSLF